MSTSTYYNFISPRSRGGSGNDNSSNNNKTPNGIPTFGGRTNTTNAGTMPVSDQTRTAAGAEQLRSRMIISGHDDVDELAATDLRHHLTQQHQAQRRQHSPIANSSASSSTSLNQFNSLTSTTSNASSSSPSSSCSSTTCSINNSISLTTCCPTTTNTTTAHSTRSSGLPRPATVISSLGSNQQTTTTTNTNHGSPLMVSIGENDMTTSTVTMTNLSSGCSSGSSCGGGGGGGNNSVSGNSGRLSLGSTQMPSNFSNYSLSQQHNSPLLPTNQTLFHSQTLHSLEPKSYKPFKSNSEYVEAMKEDLAEWLNKLYSDLDLTSDNFFSQLETGAIICRHANNVTQMGRSFLLEQKHQQQPQRQGHNQQEALAYNNKEETSLSEQNNNSINGVCLRSPSSQSPTNSSDSDKGISMASMSSLSSDPQSSMIKQQDNSLVSTVLSKTSVINYNGNGNQHNEDIGKLLRSKYQPHSSYEIHRRASSPISVSGSFLSVSPTPLITTTTSKAVDRHNINWFRVKMIPFKQDACPGTFFARDNICQFILWCRSLHILDCLLFETDDLVARKNVRSFILCLLEVARIGFKVGMPTPLIIQLEQEIDREIENDAILEREKQNQAAAGDSSSGSDCDSNFNFDAMRQAANEHEQVVDGKLDEKTKTLESVNSDKATEDSKENNNHHSVEDGAAKEEEVDEDLGPKPQVITNDLLSLHEKVVQLLCQCTCPTQFPMVRIGDGKYKVGDKLIIFVRILRRHIMVRVGGGWQELSEFLRQKDPCRSRPIQASSIQQLHNTTFPLGYNNHNHYHPSGKSTTHSSSGGPSSSMSATKLLRLGSSQQLNKGHPSANNSASGCSGSNSSHSNNYRNSNGQRLISSSVSMSWLSNSGNS